MKGFVYVKQVPSPDALKGLLDKLWVEPSYYFVRSPHAVSGISLKLPQSFPGFEGQMFNYDRELRWKKQKSVYEILLLNRVEDNLNLEFEAVPGNWEICDRPAYWYHTSQTRPPAQFPKEFLFIGANGENIKPEDIAISQRYFKDSNTATVHFVALTLSNKQ